jgi:hypothetical protein
VYFQFNPSVPISPDTHGFIGSPQLTDKIHCVAFVIDCCTVDVIPEKVLERIKSLLAVKRFPGVVLAHLIFDWFQIDASLLAATIYLVNRDYKLWNMYKLRDIYTPYTDAAGMLLHIYMCILSPSTC